MKSRRQQRNLTVHHGLTIAVPIHRVIMGEDESMNLECLTMNIAHITQYGNDQTVQLPSGFQFNTNEVCISRFGDAVVLYPKEVARNKMLQSLSEFTSDFMETRNQPESVEERNWA